MTGYRHRPRRAKYTAHTATKVRECIACGGRIEPGDIYLRRVIFRDGRAVGAISKCDQCVTIKEINGDD